MFLFLIDKMYVIQQKNRSNEAQKLEDQIEQKSKQMADLDKEASRVEKEIERLNENLADLQAQLNQQGYDTIEDEHRHLVKNRDDIEKSIEGIEHEIIHQNSKMTANLRIYEGIKKEIKDKNSHDGKRLEALKRQNEDAYKGVLWLRKPENKRMFKHEVHEPMMMVMH